MEIHDDIIKTSSGGKWIINFPIVIIEPEQTTKYTMILSANESFKN